MNRQRPTRAPGGAKMPVFHAPGADPDAANRILSTLLEASPLAIVAFDPEGVVTLWNPAAERIFGWAAEEAIGKSLPIVPAEKQEEFRTLRQQALRGESSAGMELQRRRADGSPIAVSVSTAPLRREDGTICGILSILTDVTGLRMMEEQLRLSRKMEAVGRLAGGVTNDFNNLLTAITGYCDLLLHRLPDYSALRRDVEEIRKAGDRAAALTRKLLDFGNGQVPQPEAADLNSIVTGIERMLQRRVGVDIELATELCPDLGHAAADPPLPKWAPPGTETVLLVEDEDTVRNLAREILGMNGYKVLEARHGREALLISESHHGPIHLMLTDVVMPEMTGRELADRLHPLRPGTRVLYMSGYTDDALGLRGVLEERIAFLQKPFTPEILSRKIREVLDAP